MNEVVVQKDELIFDDYTKWQQSLFNYKIHPDFCEPLDKDELEKW